jgi:hypothetical protein
MARLLRGIALLAAVLGIALWLAPALLLPGVASRALSADGVGLDFDGVRPALPWGVTAAKVVVVRGEGRVEITDASARVGASGVRLDGSVGTGTLLLKSRGLTLRGGLLRAQSLPIEAFAGLVPGALALRGALDGVYRFDARDSLEATVSRGAVTLDAPVVMEIPFAQLVIAAAREDDGAWRVDLADLHGPPLSGHAQGRIAANGGLALRIEITQLEEPARTAFGLAGLPTGPLPIQVELGGSLEQPSLTPLGAQAR